MNLPILGGGHELVFPWVRFWTPQKKSIQLGLSAFWGGDYEGYLADPEDKLLGVENRHLLSTERLLELRPGCFVLCGEPGMGKTRALDAALIAHAHPHRISLKFGDIPTWEYFLQRTRDSEAWRNWREGTHLLLLTVDGVDEGLIKIDGFVGALAGMLEPEPVSRLQLVLACRSLEWPQSEGGRLLALWPLNPKTEQPETSGTSGIYELCPLRERDVRLAANTSLTDAAGDNAGTEFMRELRRHHLVALGSRPLTLKMLLGEFAKGAGSFPKSHRELYRSCTRTLLQERDEQRSSRLRNKNLPRLTVPEKRRARVAGRIAALMLLCGRSAIARRSVSDPEATDLTVSEILHGEERLGDTAFELDETLLDAVLETPLFWPKTEGRADFYRPIVLGELVPDGAPLRPHIVWFGEAVPAMDEALAEMPDADAVVVVGTSLQVYPAAGLAELAPARARRFLVDLRPGRVPPGYRAVAASAEIGLPSLTAELDLRTLQDLSPPKS